MDKLNSIFDKFEKRKKNERAQEIKKRKNREELCHKSIQKIKSIILPTLKKSQSTIIERGHKSKIEKNLGRHLLNPRVELKISPAIEDKKASGFFSVICFAHGQSGRIKVSQEIKAGNSSSSKVSGNKKLEEIDEDWVRSQILSFVKAVLREN